MSNRDRAAEVIRAHGTEPCREPQCIAQDLADEGLITPDPPEQQRRGQQLVWPLQNHGWEVTAADGYVKLTDKYGAILAIDRKTARDLGHIFLAATNPEGSQE